MTAILSEKGQITIPKLVASKKVAHDVFTKWRGKGNLPGGLSVDAYLKRTRDAHSG